MSGQVLLIVIEIEKWPMIDQKLLCFFTSMLTENVFSVGAMKRETSYAKFAIRYVSLPSLAISRFIDLIWFLVAQDFHKVHNDHRQKQKCIYEYAYIYYLYIYLRMNASLPHKVKLCP